MLLSYFIFEAPQGLRLLSGHQEELKLEHLPLDAVSSHLLKLKLS